MTEWRLGQIAAACLHYIALYEGDLENLCFHQSLIFTKEELETFGLTEEDAAGYVEE